METVEEPRSQYVGEGEYGFERLIAWQKARALVKSIYSATKMRSFDLDRALQTQMRRAAISIVSNIAEGAERKSNKEFAQFLYIAKGSCAELRSQLYIALDIDYLSDAEFDRLISDAQEVSRLVGGLLSSVRSRDS